MPSAARTLRQEIQGIALSGVDFVPIRRRDAPAGVESQATRDVACGDAATSDAQTALNALRAEHDATCPHCTAATSHTRTVFGEGAADARLMFVGEAPGADEDRTGRPFVGRAGQKLDEMIVAMGLAREDVYIANVLKSRPPNNRTPLAHEVDACARYLERQIDIIAPEVIVALGGPAAKFLLDCETGITRLRGSWGRYQPRDGSGGVDVMPTFHPAFLLRNYTRETRHQIWADLQAVAGRLELGAGSTS